MGSQSDKDHCLKIKKACSDLLIPCFISVTSAHKDPRETLRIAAEYEGIIINLDLGNNYF